LKALGVFLIGFALAVALIFIEPAIFGGDTIIRLVHRDDLFMAHNLPLLQALISAVSRISMNSLLIRILDAALGALGGVGFYWMAGDLFGEKWALPAALLYITNPFFLALSTVPFQEPLMLACLVLAFHFFYREQWPLASLFLALACFTRYEVWAACPVLALAYILRKDRTLIGCIKAALLFGWTPAVWLVAHRGLSAPGHFVIERSLSIWRLQRYPYLAWITVKNTPVTVLLLAAIGIWFIWKKHLLSDWRLKIQLAFVLLFLAAIPFSAHGVLPDPERYVTAREAFIPIYAVLLAAVIGLDQWPRFAKPIVAVSVVLGIAGAWVYVHRETSKPEVDLGYRLAKYLDRAVQDNERALVLSKPITEESLQPYLAKARATGGEEGLRQARLELQNADLSGTDFHRTLAQSRLGPARLLAPPADCAEWIAVWDDYPEASQVLSGAQPADVLRSGPRSVTILRRQCVH